MRNGDNESLLLAWDDNSLYVHVCMFSLCWGPGAAVDVEGGIHHRNYKEKSWQTSATGPACYCFQGNVYLGTLFLEDYVTFNF